MKKFYTIGMAGHIDHGKTTLTKALTGVETDRLKEEKERNISIEPGFAPLVQSESLQISMIDVPGHERFIRQMIAGVAGIDFVLLVIAADEGVMPQTREHLQILSLLGIEAGAVVLSKADLVEEDWLSMVLEELKEVLAGSFLEGKPIYKVDSLSGKGIQQLKEDLVLLVQEGEKRSSFPSFRLPIDHVFTVKGQGAVVRGTIFDGSVQIGDQLTALPQQKQVRVRQIESHHQSQSVAVAGQRAALNIAGMSYDELKRGDVLVKDDFYSLSSILDVSLTSLTSIEHPIKQGQAIKVHVGTSEVNGKIHFYDRREHPVGKEEEILCQISLQDAVVVTRGDRFILRRASPVETLGGGWIIDPNGIKRPFGQASLRELAGKKEGTASQRIENLLRRYHALHKDELIRLAAVSETVFLEIEPNLISIGKEVYTNEASLKLLLRDMVTRLQTYHEQYPLRVGMDKASLISSLQNLYPPDLIEFCLSSSYAGNRINLVDHFVHLVEFQARLPIQWEKRIERSLDDWRQDGAEVKKMNDYFIQQGIDEAIYGDLYHYLLHSQQAYEFDEGRLLSRELVRQLKEKLFEASEGEAFTLQMARESLHLTRKNLVPLLELFDRLNFTERVGDQRIWLNNGESE